MKVALEEIYQQRLFIFERGSFTVLSIHIIPQRLEKISRVRRGCKKGRYLQKKKKLKWDQSLLN